MHKTTKRSQRPSKSLNLAQPSLSQRVLKPTHNLTHKLRYSSVKPRHPHLQRPVSPQKSENSSIFTQSYQANLDQPDQSNSSDLRSSQDTLPTDLLQSLITPTHSSLHNTPDPSTIAAALTQTGDGDQARKKIISYFRDSSRQSDLSKISQPVPYLLPIGESSPTTYPIPEYLLHTLYHLSATTVANYGLGMAAPQFGVNYRMFVFRSEVFACPSVITNIPYVVETTDQNHCMVTPRRMQRQYGKPMMFENMALSWDNPDPDYDHNSKPPVNTSKSMVDYHDMDGDNDFIASQPGAVQYHLQKTLKMPLRDAKQLNLCDDRILLQQDQAPAENQPPQSRVLGRSTGNNVNRIISNNSFINEYRGYSVPLSDIERPLFTPLLQAFQQHLPATPIINPRVTAIRNEYFAMREGCFSFPHWHAFVSRPIACDVEFETLEIQSAQIPTAQSRDCLNSALMSASLASPVGSTQRHCPPISQSGLDEAFLDSNVTRQLQISRILPKPEQVKLVTRRVTMRDIASKVFLHEYDHLDGIQFFDRASGSSLNWQGSARQHHSKQTPHARFEYPVEIGGAYF